MIAVSVRMGGTREKEMAGCIWNFPIIISETNIEQMTDQKQKRINMKKLDLVSNI